MFTKFFYNLRNANIPVTLLEYLTLLKAVKLGLSEYKVNKFYYLARTCLVKDERNLDKFDLVFAKSFEGVEYYLNHQDSTLDIPAEWLRSVAEKVMTAEEMAKVKKTNTKTHRKTLSAETSVCVTFGASASNSESKTTPQGPAKDVQGTPKETPEPTLRRVKTLLNVLKRRCA